MTPLQDNFKASPSENPAGPWGLFLFNAVIVYKIWVKGLIVLNKRALVLLTTNLELYCDLIAFIWGY